MLVEIGSVLIDIGQNLPEFGPKLVEPGPMLIDSGSISTDVGRIGSKSADPEFEFGQALADLGFGFWCRPWWARISINRIWDRERTLNLSALTLSPILSPSPFPWLARSLTLFLSFFLY